MVKTDGRPTIAWADPPRGESCPVLTAPGKVTRVRLDLNDPEVVKVIRERFPDAEIVVPT